MRTFDPRRHAATVSEGCSNTALDTVNDHVVRLSVMTGPFGWHVHPNSDECFQVVKGDLVVDFNEGGVTLAPGEMLTVPAGTPHHTRPAGERSVNITFERADTQTAMLSKGGRSEAEVCAASSRKRDG